MTVKKCHYYMEPSQKIQLLTYETEGNIHMLRIQMLNNMYPSDWKSSLNTYSNTTKTSRLKIVDANVYQKF